MSKTKSGFYFSVPLQKCVDPNGYCIGGRIVAIMNDVHLLQASREFDGLVYSTRNQAEVCTIAKVESVKHSITRYRQYDGL